MKATASTNGRDLVADFMHWQRRYLHTPGDRLYIATPMAFPKVAPPAVYWVTEARKMLQETWSAKKDYNRFMNLFVDTAHRFGLDGAIADPEVCSAVEARHGTKALLKDKVGLFDVSILKSSSICVNNFFQSTKNKSAAEVKQVSKMKMQDGSIWDEVCKLVSARSPVQVQDIPSVRSVKRRSIKPRTLPQRNWCRISCPRLASVGSGHRRHPSLRWISAVWCR